MTDRETACRDPLPVSRDLAGSAGNRPGLRRDGAAAGRRVSRRGLDPAGLVAGGRVLLVTLVLCGVFGWERRLGFYGMFVTDAFAVFMKALVLLGSAVSIILALRFNEEHRIARFEFPVLILLASTGMMVMVSANDLITLYLGLELQSLCALCRRQLRPRLRCARPKPG